MATIFDKSIIPTNTKILPETELKELLRIAKEKDHPRAQAAKETIVFSNYRLILRCIYRFDTEDDINDLFQIGCIGLLRAIDTFDFQYDVRFTTYAVPSIMNELYHYFRNTQPVHVSRTIRETGIKIYIAKTHLLRELNREPSLKEIAEAIHETEQRVNQTLHTLKMATPISIDQPFETSNGTYENGIRDTIAHPYTEEDMLTEISFKDVMRELSVKERTVIQMSLYQGISQKQIARHMCISQSQVSRIRKSAINKIRNHI